MAYQYVTFDGIALPLYNHSQNHDVIPTEPTIVDSIGGAWDWFGSARRRGRKQTISLTGLYFAENYTLVDENGNIVTDEFDDPIVVAAGVASLRAQVDALLEKRGERGSLWRKRLDDDVLQWKTARLLQIQWPRVWEDHARLATITCVFETLMETWRAATETTTSNSATDGVQLGLTVESSGEVQIDDATLTITRTSGTITEVDVVCAANGIDFTWTGSLGASDVLTINCSNQTVRENSTDAYSGFVLNAGHTAAGWLPLFEGSNPLLVTVTGGNATVAVSHYDQFA